MSESTFKAQKFTDYQKVLDYLYTQLPMFQRIGAAAFKKDLTNTIKLCEALDNPQKKFKTVHIAGTNGKGSSSHYIASILQSAGYTVGLYTSPHLKSFTERIKINGLEIPQHEVLSFVNRVLPLIDEIKPSFFEITVAMAFDYFAHKQVDIAVIEVGMGGRLDSTNVIDPEVSLITNIGSDHEQWLGSSLIEIAGEKAGIIKPDKPVVIGERQQELIHVFVNKAQQVNAPLRFGQDHFLGVFEDDIWTFESKSGLTVQVKASGLAEYQKKNLIGVLSVINVLIEHGFEISKESVETGICLMKSQTGLKGRWQKLGENPLIMCDVGHNVSGIELILDQINKTSYDRLYIVFGTVNDKDITKVLKILPTEAYYLFCQANIPRALDATSLYEKAMMYNLRGEVVTDVNKAINKAKSLANINDLIFIGGSTFVVAEIDNL